LLLRRTRLDTQPMLVARRDQHGRAVAASSKRGRDSPTVSSAAESDVRPIVARTPRVVSATRTTSCQPPPAPRAAASTTASWTAPAGRDTEVSPRMRSTKISCRRHAASGGEGAVMITLLEMGRVEGADNRWVRCEASTVSVELPSTG
jgi:hypothetical protein